MFRVGFTFKHILLGGAFIALPLFIILFWYTSSGDTITSFTETYQGAGKEVRADFQSLPTLPLTEEAESYHITDTSSDGVSIQFANESEGDNSLGGSTSQSALNLSFPKDYSQPLEVKLDEQRSIQITDLGGKDDYTVDTLSHTITEGDKEGIRASSLWQQIKQFGGLTSKQEEAPPTYLRYTSQDGRKELLYAYQKDQATGEKKLKHWTLYQEGTGLEQEAYRIDNAKVKINENGVAEVYYYGEKEIQNEAVKAEVDSNLLERAQRTLAKEMGEDLLSGNKVPDITIPKPYYLDHTGERHDLEWKWNAETSTLSVSFSPQSYPVALDPTLQFTAPGVSNGGDVITGESSSWNGGTPLALGDFNADGRTDLAVGATGYATDTGRVYIFYNDGSIPTTAATADVIITGETTNNRFGISLIAGDFNADGRTDLAVGAERYSTYTGRTYIFYNDGSIPATAATADVIITGETTNTSFGWSLSVGDFNADGRTDLIVGANGYSTNTGRAYLFYNDGSIPTTAATADVIITGGATGDRFGAAFASGDFNTDGRTDLAIGAFGYSSSTGRAYIFYNDGSIPTTAGTADVTITGGATNNRFGFSLTAGDFNADSRIDLAVSAQDYSSSTGRAYLFYNDGSIPTTAGTADVTITGEATSNFFGYALTAGDFNGDGRTDLATGADGYSSNTGRAYIFYNDGSIPTTAGTADVIITGNQVNSLFGIASVAGDLNADGRTDLIVYATGVLARTYIFYSQNGQVNTNQSITGETTTNNFGISLTSGDFNSDGRTDLAVGASGYSTNTGRVYLFYGDGQIPSTAGTADVTITGGATSNYFGLYLTSGDFNADGRTDLAISAYGYSSTTGRAYLFYNDGSIPTTAGTADVTITGGASFEYFGVSLTSGDFNADGRTDLAVGATGYNPGGNPSTGRVYIFHNDGSIPTTAGTADVAITGGASNNYFGKSLAAGDFNADGRTDLVIGATGYSNFTGRAYLFYNDGSIPTTAGTADVTITGDGSTTVFGSNLAAADFNADSRIDIAIGADDSQLSGLGKVYLFYNDGSIPTTADTADVTITGEASGFIGGFSSSFAVGDWNADGRTDLAVGAYGYSTSTGRAYIFYNDGSIPTTAATADVIITGEATSNYFGSALAAGDLNGDGRTDLAVGAYGNSTSTGKVYLYETRENFAWQIQRQSQPGSGPLRVGTNTTGQELKITGETSGGSFGYTLSSGDFNTDGKSDLVVGARTYSSNTGRVYIFYADGSLANGAKNADVIITGGATFNNFGATIASGDFNADGQTDLVVGANGYSSATGRAYIFYNDGSIPTTAGTADVTITGGTASDSFGDSLASGDFNADGRTDLAVGASGYSSFTGRAYLFYNDGSIPTTAGTADVTITGGTASDSFGYSLASGDFNADGRTDLAVGAYGYSSYTGRAYIFYNDGSIPTTAATADVTITGETTTNYFGISLTSGDFNADGKIDLAVGATAYSSFTGRAYIFYNDGSIPTTAGTADVTITGEASNNVFGWALSSGDFNADGKIDLAIGTYGYSSSTGRAYLFYNDGSIPTTATTADITLTGETSFDSFGYSLLSGDFNADGRTDLAVGALGYSSSSNIGRVYVYTLGHDPVITGEATNNYFGISSLTSGDFNADGRTDLAVVAYGYSTNTGRAYIFYNDGSIPTTAGTADVTITGEATSNYFGSSLTSGDWNADGRTDLAVGAFGYSSFTGRAYIFYNDGSIPTTAGTADVIITGGATSNYFGNAISSGDYNADGRIDLVVGAYQYSSNTGRAYIFYNDGSIPTTAGTADVTITGGATSDSFGQSLVTGDFNADGRTDLAVGADGYSSSTGRAYIFYNDGSIPTTADTADVIITGELSPFFFGTSLTSGDFNADGRIDLVVTAYYLSYGRVYIFYNDGSIPTTAGTADVIITGENSSGFSSSLAVGDYNTDGRTDLAVGAMEYSSNTGRAYIFYNDGSIPTTAGTADVTITGETTDNYFGVSLTSGDWNSDGRTDLAVGARGYSTNTGRVYVYTSEVASSSFAEDRTLKASGTVKTRGTLKVR